MLFRSVCREVPGKLLAAVADLATRPLAGVLTLGDIVNGNGPASERNEEEFELVASILDGLVSNASFCFVFFSPFASPCA